MKIKGKSKSVQVSKEDLYFSGQQDDYAPTKKQHSSTRKSSNVKIAKTQQTKTETIKKQHNSSSRRSSSSRPRPVNNNMQIKLEPSDIRFIQKIVEQKHGKILTHEQMTSLKKKMVRQNFNQSNPYNEMNYNTGERNQWKDNKKKTLTEEDKVKLKKHFLNIMKMVDKGAQSKYTLRDLAMEFNLADSALSQIKRHFQSDPDVSYHLKKFANKTDPQKQSSQIQQIVKKRSMLEKMMHKNPLLTKTELAQKIARYTKDQNFLPEYQIVRLLQQQGFNWRQIVKYPQSRNFKQNLQRKKTFCEKINYILTETKYSVYFLGVMNFNSFMFRTQGWTKDEYLIDPIIDQSFSLVALTQRSGEGTWKFQKQVYKEEIFGQTCKILFDQLISESFEPKYIAVDFRLFKYQNMLKKSRKKYDVQIIWIPPFSNLLNPLEFWFQDIRNSLCKSKKLLQLSVQLNIPEQKSQILIKDIYNDLKNIFTQKYDTNFDFGDFFQMAAKYHKKALQMQKF